MTVSGIRDFFVSLRRGERKPRIALLAGPFATHAEALALVDPARQEASRVDPWTDFDAVGTLSLTAGSGRVGVLNDRLDVGRLATNAAAIGSPIERGTP